MGAVARRSGADEGPASHRRHPNYLRLEALGAQRAHGKHPGGGAASGRRRDHRGQDQHARVRRRSSDLQRGRRHDQQSLGPQPEPRRLDGRRRGGVGGGPRVPGAGQRSRRVDSQPVALLRDLRPQALVRAGAAQRAAAAGSGRRIPRQSVGQRPDGSQRARSALRSGAARRASLVGSCGLSPGASGAARDDDSRTTGSATS